MHNYRELKIWQRGVALASKVYELTSTFPADEKYGLSSQLKRASVSISSNIAEGSGRNSDKDFQNFLGYAYGSLCEVDTQLQIAVNLNFVKPDEIKELLSEIDELQRMIYGFRKNLNF